MIHLFVLFLAGLQATGNGIEQSATPVQETTLVGAGSPWRYWDKGTDPGPSWRHRGFDDTGWAEGDAQLGYGDGDETTVVSFGPNASNKYTTTYFRRRFEVFEPDYFVGLRLRLLRDDGAIVYLNGKEVVRSNMPAGPITNSTFAASTVGGSSEDAFFSFFLPTVALKDGRNLLAVEVHQRSLTSSDISFDLSLEAYLEREVVRGPYLQLGTSDGVTVRWRSNVLSNSRVWYGEVGSSTVKQAKSNPLTLDHSVRLNGLKPNTDYWYSVGHDQTPLAAGPDQTFRTPPLIGTVQPLRFWVIGDSGTAGPGAFAVRDSYANFTGSTHTDAWLMLGDNAYGSGTDAEYQAAVFETYPSMLKKSVLWSTRGNHETLPSVYYGIFDLPTQAEAGGLPSGTEAYYSFDWGNVHFVCLDSQGSDRTVGGPMYTWLENDLESTTLEWIIAFWHHPPYTKGSHDSDTETKLVEMRTVFLPALEAGGADLVLTGHSHSYERSFFIDGHYGHSSTFGAAHTIDGGDGNENGNGAYTKMDLPNAGAVYAVAGSSGKTSAGPLNHPAMFFSRRVLGSVVLDIDGTRLDASFLGANGVVEDSFTILHVQSAGLGAPRTAVSNAEPQPIDMRLDPGIGFEHAPFVLVARAPGEHRALVADPLGVLATGNLDEFGEGRVPLSFQAGTLDPLVGLDLELELWVLDPVGGNDVIWTSAPFKLAVRP